MAEALAFFAVCFPSIFAIVDPIACVPIFVGLVGKDSREIQRRTALRASLTLLVVLGVFAIGGPVIFKFFGITIPAFKVAGGVILFGVAFEMLHAKQSATRTTSEETAEAETRHEAGVIPLGIPLLSGPGAIATVMMWASRAKHTSEQIALVATIVLLATITLIALLSSTRLVSLMGGTGIKIATRIMGLILAATAAQFVIDGVTEAFPAWAKLPSVEPVTTSSASSQTTAPL